MRLIITALLVSGVFSFSAAQAASCKGLEKTACGAASCTWVDSYKRKDGRLVQGYCRTKRSSKSASDPLAALKQK